MANSIIDDMLKNQVPPKKKSGSKVAVVFLIILLILAVAAAVVAVLYLKKQNEVTPKQYFMQYLGKINTSEILNFEKMDTFQTRLQNEAEEATTEISATVSSGLFESELDLSELKLEVNSKNDPVKEKNSSDIILTYKGNEIVTFNALSNNEKIGIFSEEIITKYIGAKYVNLPDVISKITGEEMAINVDLEALKDTEIVFPEFSITDFAKYAEILNQKAPEESFSSKPVTLDRQAGKIDSTEYSMKLNESQMIEIVDLLLQTLENDDQLLDRLLSTLGDNAEEIKEMIKSEIEVYINSLYENTPDNTKIYTINLYGAGDVVYKILLDFYGEYSVDIDFYYAEKENSMEITFLEAESQTGYSLELVKTISDVTEDLDLTVNMIEDSEIVGKIELVSNLVNSGNSYTWKNKIEVNFMIFAVTLQTNSQISFKQVAIPNLTDDNCLFLDELDEDTFDDVIEAISVKAEEVMNEKLVSQGVREPEEEEPSGTMATINTEAFKEAAKVKLINAISEAMGEAEAGGRSFGLIDLTVLEIPDSTFSVFLDGDVAILNIDGFEFKLNSEFQLYE
ncbi:MAG: hypothetical protein IJ867_06385 [Clostridia bacterium]|nr:hypothetical protein [Clostridia bacterium]